MARGKVKDRDGIYQRKDRPGWWASWIDAQGKRRQRKLDAHTLTQARILLNAEKARVEKTVTMGYAPPTVESFAIVSERFLKHQKARLTPASYTRDQGIIARHLQPFFGASRIADIRRVDVQRYITQRSGEVAPGSIVKELNVLKHLLSLAVQWELIPVNPAHGVKPPRVPAGRVRYLQPTELRSVLGACPEWVRPIIFNGSQMVPDYVTQVFARACRTCGIEDFRFHDLRHTAASWMRMHGADIHTVAQILGHKDLRMAARYQHLSPAFLSDAVNLLDRAFAGPQNLLAN
jgi:site-specific recombinase XerD